MRGTVWIGQEVFLLRITHVVHKRMPTQLPCVSRGSKLPPVAYPHTDGRPQNNGDNDHGHDNNCNGYNHDSNHNHDHHSDSTIQAAGIQPKMFVGRSIKTASMLKRLYRRPLWAHVVERLLRTMCFVVRMHSLFARSTSIHRHLHFVF